MRKQSAKKLNPIMIYMGLDLKMLKEVQEELATRNTGDDLYFYAKNIGEETDIRILEPLANLNGSYFLELTVFWINKKPYVCPSTFKKKSVIQEEIDEAKEEAKTDKGLAALLADKEEFKKSSEFWMPILLLKPIFDKTGKKVVDYEVIDDAPKVLSCGPMLMKAINKVVTTRKYQGESDNGITDRVEGYNLILSKVGKKLDTEYYADGDVQFEFDEKYYKEDVIPDIIALAKGRIKSDDYLRSVIRNYLYGEEIIEDDSEAAKGAKTEAKTSRTGRGKKEEDEEQPVRGSRTRAAEPEDEPVRGSRTRAAEPEDEPVRGKRKPASEPEPEDEPPFEEDEVKPKGKPVKPAAKVEAPVKKKSALDALDDLD